MTLSGAVACQLSQALGSFVLQAVVARTLGASGLGTFALLYSVIVTCTALANGLVGDSLTVLDRADGPVRAALQRWTTISSLAPSVVSAVPLVLLGLLEPVSALLFVAASATFVAENLLRRLLMAELRFWSVVVIDGFTMAASFSTLVVWSLAGTLTLDAVLVALVAGQVAGGVAAVPLLPARERTWASAPRAMAVVWRYGSLRATQQLIRPTMLTVVRVLLVVVAGEAAFGRLEGARIYVAPAILVVQGLSSYLFASYARDRETPLPRLIPRADRSALAIGSLTLALGGVATALTGTLGPVLTGGSFSLDPVAVLGWSAFAAASAVSSPYASLAAVRSRQRVVVSHTLTVAAVTLVVVAGCVLAGAPVASTPYLIGLGLLVQAGLLRNRVLRRAEP